MIDAERNNIFSRNKFRSLSQAKGAALFLIILSVLFLSCRKLEFSAIEFQEKEQIPGAGIAVSAQFLSDPEEINQLFHTFLPDSGIVPVQVGVRNNDTASIVLNGSSFPGLREKLGGISFTVEGEKFSPLKPFEVIERIQGGKRTGYRQKGAGNIVASIIFPPLGGYYIYDEATKGRLFRGLAGNSFYKMSDQYFFQHLTLKPGEERVGYLYFPLSPDLSPYEIVSVPGRKKRDKILKEIKVKDPYNVQLSIKVEAIPASLDLGVYGRQQDTLSFYDICFDPPEYSNAEKLPGFLLKKNRKGRAESKLVFVVFPYPPKTPVRPEKEVEIDDIHTVAKIADVVTGVDFAACGVNFTRKSRIYFLARAKDGARLLWQRNLKRNILRLAAVEEGLLAVCDDGFCYYLSGRDGQIDKRYVKFAAELDDIFCYSDKLYGFSNKKLSVFSIDRENLFDRISTFEIDNAERRVVGIINNSAVLIYHSKRTPGDTLVLMNPEDMSEIYRIPLPGRVAAAGCDGKIVAQLQNGVVLQFVPGRDGFFLKGSLLLSSLADELVAAGDTVFVATEEGVIDIFNIKDRLSPPRSYSREIRLVPSPARKKRGAGNK